jgi:Uri superfamily endonuclease
LSSLMVARLSNTTCRRATSCGGCRGESRTTLTQSPEPNMFFARTGIQASPGTYALLLSSATDTVIRVGRLGNLRLQPGFYVYVGSALGSGGVRGRLGHHMRPAERPHWHIDYLRKKTTLEAVWFCYNRKPQEHAWAKRFAAMPGASVPMAGFGSSDCACESHLFYFKDCPADGRGSLRGVIGVGTAHRPRFVRGQSIRQRPPDTGAQKSRFGGVPRA